MGFSGLWRGVLRVKSGRRRGADGRFYRGIPGFLAWVRARGGDSAHGGRCRAGGAKKFLKIGNLFASSIAHLIGVSPLVRPAIL